MTKTGNFRVGGGGGELDSGAGNNARLLADGMKKEHMKESSHFERREKGRQKSIPRASP